MKSNSGSSRKSTGSGNSSDGKSSSATLKPTLCTKGCGFYGSAAFDGLCSQCYNSAHPVKSPAATPTGTTQPATPAATPKTTGKSRPFRSRGVTFTADTAKSAKSATIKRPPTPHPVSKVATPKMASGKRAVTPQEAIKEEDQEPAVKRPRSEATKAQPADKPSSPTDAEDNVEAVKSTPSKRSQRKGVKTARCNICKKSIAIIGFDCRCGGRFCVNHRLANQHDCHFDYRAAGAEELTKANPKVVGEKITKI